MHSLHGSSYGEQARTLGNPTRELPRTPPTFIRVVQPRILDDAQGGRGWLENASPLEMAVEELPLAPYGGLDR